VNQTSPPGRGVPGFPQLLVFATITCICYNYLYLLQLLVFARDSLWYASDQVAYHFESSSYPPE